MGRECDFMWACVDSIIPLGLAYLLVYSAAPLLPASCANQDALEPRLTYLTLEVL